MQIISNTNTASNNTLNIADTTDMTLFDILSSDSVMEFFDNEYGVEDIAEHILSINGADADAIINNIDSISAEEDMVIVIDLYGEIEEEQEREAHTAGKVSITCGGGLGSKEVAIVDGVTTVNDLLTPSLATFYATTTDNLRNRKVYINDEEATVTSVVRNGDIVVLENRKAGDKGAMKYTLIDNDGVEYDILSDNEVTYKEVLEAGQDEGLYDEFPVITVIDGAEIPDVIYSTVLSGEATDGSIIEVDCAFNIQNSVDEEDTAQAPARGTIGQVKVFIQGSSQNKLMNIVSGVTTMSEVVFSDKILNLGALTREQAESLVYSINGVQSPVNAVLNAGDEISMEARRAGDKGC